MTRAKNKSQVSVPTIDSPSSQPSRTLEGREGQLVSLAVDLAEKQLRNGTASSQIITHYLKLGSVREQMEREELKHRIELLEAKTEAIKASKNYESEFTTLLEAMRKYQGVGHDENQIV